MLYYDVIIIAMIIGGIVIVKLYSYHYYYFYILLLLLLLLFALCRNGVYDLLLLVVKNICLLDDHCDAKQIIFFLIAVQYIYIYIYFCIIFTKASRAAKLANRDHSKQSST